MSPRMLVAALTLLSIACADRGDVPQARQAGAPAPVSLAAANDQFLTAGELRLRYRDAGNRTGAPIVLIHGYSRSLEDWLMLADSFSVHHRVIAYDVRGFGQSSKFSDAGRYGAAMAEDVIALLDHLRIDRAHLIGHSMGALIAGNAAARYPQRIASASLIAGPFHSDSATFSRETARWVRDLQRGAGLRHFLPWLFPGLPDSVARAMSAQTFSTNDSVALIATMRSFGGLAVPRDRAAAATVPVFIAAGTRDPLTPLSRRLATEWPHAHYVELADVDHLEILTRPEVMAGMRMVMAR